MSSAMDHDRMQQIHRRNRRVLGVLAAVVVSMVVMAYASVPLYNLFCRVTGYGGTVERVAENTSRSVIGREMTVRFDSNTAPNMPWLFKPEAKEVSLKVGEDGFTNFIAKNPTQQPVTGTALFNVTPIKAAPYFKKVQCFCFDKQTLNPGQAVNMPVQFYVDPAITDDPNLDDVKTITLSYTFFRAESRDLEVAMDTFYNEPDDEGPQTEKVMN